MTLQTVQHAETQFVRRGDVEDSRNARHCARSCDDTPRRLLEQTLSQTANLVGAQPEEWKTIRQRCASRPPQSIGGAVLDWTAAAASNTTLRQ